MGIVLLEQCVGLPEEGGKGFIHEVGAGSVGVAMLGEVRAQGLLDRTVAAVEYHLTQGSFASEPGRFVTEEVADEPRMIL